MRYRTKGYPELVSSQDCPLMIDISRALAVDVVKKVLLGKEGRGVGGGVEGSVEGRNVCMGRIGFNFSYRIFHFVFQQ